MLKYNISDLIGRPIFDLYSNNPSGKEKARRMFERFIDGREIVNEELEMVRSDGRPVFISLTVMPVKDESGRVIESRSMAVDITERKEAEEKQQRLNRELRAISSCNQALLKADDEQALLNDVCRIVCDEAGYRLAWVGYVEHDKAKSVRPVAWAGFESGYIEKAQLSWSEETERGRGPAGISIRSGEALYVNDFKTNRLMEPWRESAMRRGYQSGIALPLKDNKARVFGVLLIYSAEANAINQDEANLLEELAADLAFGINTLHERSEREIAVKGLLESEAKFRAVSETESAAIFIIQGERFVFLNRAAELVSGYTVAELEKMTFSDIIHPDFREMAESRAAQRFQGEEPVPRYEIKIVAKTGEERWLDYAGKTIDYQGKPAILGTALDITERKRIAEEAKAKDMAIRQAYVDVFNAVTGGKLVIMTAEEVEVSLGHPVGDEFLVSTLESISIAKDETKEVIRELLPGMDTFGLTVAMVEALTNAVTHAREGSLRLYKKDDTVQIVISDSGPGIDFSVLPKAALEKGFSTKQSLGLGFSIMLDESDRVLLATEPGRTIVVLEKSRWAVKKQAA